MNRIPIRWRLTLGYGAMLMLVVMVAGIMVVSSPWWREGEADTFVTQQQAGRKLAILAIRDGASVNLTASTSLAGEGMRYVELTGKMITGAPAAPLVPTGASLEVISPASVIVYHGRDGHVSFQSFTGVPLSMSAAWQGPEPLLLAMNPRSNAAGLISGEPRTQPGIVESTGAKMDELVPIVPIALALLLLVMAVGYLLSGRALRPVTRMTSLVSTIGTEDLHIRLNLNMPNDEIGQLARTVDGMLDRVQQGYDRQAQFTGNAAHELRTPLTSMRALIDLTLKRARTTDEYRDAISQLDVDLGRLTDLVETLLALARAESGRLELDASRFSLDQTIDTVVEMFRQQEGVGALDLCMKTEPLEITGDEDLVIQVLVNLIDNACRHTPAGGNVTVSCWRKAQLAVIRVTDSGEGIAAPHLDRVFERFYRAESNHRGGAGLGLAITRAIVERHGGTIALESTVGLGTVATVRLPVDPMT